MVLRHVVWAFELMWWWVVLVASLSVKETSTTSCSWLHCATLYEQLSRCVVGCSSLSLWRRQAGIPLHSNIRRLHCAQCTMQHNYNQSKPKLYDISTASLHGIKINAMFTLMIERNLISSRLWWRNLKALAHTEGAENGPITPTKLL